MFAVITTRKSVILYVYAAKTFKEAKELARKETIIEAELSETDRFEFDGTSGWVFANDENGKLEVLKRIHIRELL